MKILVFGASGMLGHVLYTELKKNHEVYGTVRSKKWDPNLYEGYETSDLFKVDQLINLIRPDYVINCIGIIKQLKESKNKISSIEINSLWPHKLAELCEKHNAKMIHFSTDCVFSGDKGNYKESDLADARDTYGLTKYLGESDTSNVLTLRTSIIGHELDSNVSLVDWFLSQKSECKGYTHAIYSGFPTVVVAKFLNDYVFNNFKSGVYQFSSEPINKFELIKLISKVYDKKITIHPNEDVVIDRSLNSDRLRESFNFKPQSWEDMIVQMHKHFLESGLYKNKGIN